MEVAGAGAFVHSPDFLIEWGHTQDLEGRFEGRSEGRGSVTCPTVLDGGSGTKVRRNVPRVASQETAVPAQRVATRGS